LIIYLFCFITLCILLIINFLLYVFYSDLLREVACIDVPLFISAFYLLALVTAHTQLPPEPRHKSKEHGKYAQEEYLIVNGSKTIDSAGQIIRELALQETV
jgi:hypothetical protein